jgi:Domain of unknown function DUF29
VIGSECGYKTSGYTTLYESDFALWLEEQARALKERHAAALGWDNLAEEIEGLGQKRPAYPQELSPKCPATHARTRILGSRMGAQPETVVP